MQDDQTPQPSELSSEPVVNNDISAPITTENSNQNESNIANSQPITPVISNNITNTTTEEKTKKEGGLVSFVLTLVAALVLVQVINMFVFQSYKVFGSSMFPTLHDGDRLIISKYGKTLAKVTNKDFVPKRSDIIVFVDPLQPDLQLIKRVIGLPGERVVVKNGKITVYNKQNPNGFNPDDAPYGKNLPVTSGNTDITVPSGHLFVSGDNREGSNSLDSRNELGTVPEDNIIGKLEVRIFPFDKAMFF